MLWFHAIRIESEINFVIQFTDEYSLYQIGSHYFPTIRLGIGSGGALKNDRFTYTPIPCWKN